MAVTKTKIDRADGWTLIAADVTALTLVQIHSGIHDEPVAELSVAGSLPAATDSGVALWAGDTVSSAVLPDLGATGALYARAVCYAAWVTIAA